MKIQARSGKDGKDRGEAVSVEELTKVMHDLGETALENRLEQLVSAPSPRKSIAVINTKVLIHGATKVATQMFHYC